jgi:hypothetical protein
MRVTATKRRALRASPTLEINFGEPEAFALVVQTATDGDRVTARKAQSAADQQTAEQQQPLII